MAHHCNHPLTRALNSLLLPLGYTHVANQQPCTISNSLLYACPSAPARSWREHIAMLICLWFINSNLTQVMALSCLPTGPSVASLPLLYFPRSVHYPWVRWNSNSLALGWGLRFSISNQLQHDSEFSCWEGARFWVARSQWTIHFLFFPNTFYTPSQMAFLPYFTVKTDQIRKKKKSPWPSLPTHLWTPHLLCECLIYCLHLTAKFLERSVSTLSLMPLLILSWTHSPDQAPTTSL